MSKVQAPQLKNTPSPVVAPKLKPTKRTELSPEPTLSAGVLDEGTSLPAPVLKVKMKNVKGAFGKKKTKATPKEKVKLTHNEKMAARRELRKTSKLKRKEALQAAKKTAKKAKRTARRNAEKRKAAGRNFTAG